MRRDGSGDEPTVEDQSSGESFAVRAFPYLLRPKITIPDRVAGYVDRAELMDRAMPTRRRLTVLKAAGGFGKTTLLAECCRQLRQDGVATAYVSLDEHDTPDTLVAHIALACASAGLDALHVTNEEVATGVPEDRIAVVAREIQSLGSPFVIAFDELERLAHPASAATLEFLLQRGPSNLHLAFACRRIPDGVNVAGALLEGRAEVLETKDLRFSRADVARLFDLRLSRRALSREVNHSAGWPFALRISRNTARHGTEGKRGGGDDLVGNWIESRLFADLGQDDRDLVLDLGLFGWVDESLLAEVLQSRDPVHRVETMAALEGLLERVSYGATQGWRLHPLVRDHCAKRRFREDPERFATIHRRIATALARRGDTVQAMRHATDGGDPFQAGEILERAGGVRFWTRFGVAQFLEADRLLPEEAVGESPRLKLARCAALMLSGQLHQARSLYAECWRPGHCANEDATEFEWSVDDCIVRGAMGLYGGEPVGSDWIRTLGDDMASLVASPRLDLPTRGHFEYALCVLHFIKGEFDSALERLSAARELLGTRYIECHAELLHGQVDFVKGRFRDANAHYRRSQRIARKWLAADPVVGSGCAIALKEAALEWGSASTGPEPPANPGALMQHGVPFGYFAMASNVLIETELRFGRVDEALAVANELLAHVRRAGLTSLARVLAALRATVLVIAGRMAEAERAWRLGALPEDPAGCTDLATQSWREMEAVSEARARLLIAAQRFREARDLLRALHAVAEERGFRRTQMRALALSIVLERQAGDTAASAHYLTDYLELYSESPYAWPLVRERATCSELVGRFLETSADALYSRHARSLLAAMRRDGSSLSFSEREREILQRLPGNKVKQVAASLGLTVHGVRYHLRKLFAKLGASNRDELLRRARELGLIPEDS